MNQNVDELTHADIINLFDKDQKEINHFYPVFPAEHIVKNLPKTSKIQIASLGLDTLGEEMGIEDLYPFTIKNITDKYVAYIFIAKRFSGYGEHILKIYDTTNNIFKSEVMYLSSAMGDSGSLLYYETWLYDFNTDGILDIIEREGSVTYDVSDDFNESNAIIVHGRKVNTESFDNFVYLFDEGSFVEKIKNPKQFNINFFDMYHCPMRTKVN